MKGNFYLEEQQSILKIMQAFYYQDPFPTEKPRFQFMLSVPAAKTQLGYSERI